MPSPVQPLPAHITELYAHLWEDEALEVHAALLEFLEYVREEMRAGEEELYLRRDGAKVTVWAGWNQTSYPVERWQAMQPALLRMGCTIQRVDQRMFPRVPLWRFQGWCVHWTRPGTEGPPAPQPEWSSLDDLLQEHSVVPGARLTAL